MCAGLFTVQWSKKKHSHTSFSSVRFLLDVPAWDITADMRCTLCATNDVTYPPAEADMQMSQDAMSGALFMLFITWYVTGTTRRVWYLMDVTFRQQREATEAATRMANVQTPPCDIASPWRGYWKCHQPIIYYILPQKCRILYFHRSTRLLQTDTGGTAGSGVAAAIFTRTMFPNSDWGKIGMGLIGSGVYVQQRRI